MEQLRAIQLNLISNAKKALPIAKQKKSENTHVIQKRHL
jgi:hypothetical protein